MRHRFRHLLNDAPPSTATFTYDSQGRLVEMTDPKPDDAQLDESCWYDPRKGRWLDEDDRDE